MWIVDILVEAEDIFVDFPSLCVEFGTKSCGISPETE